MITFWVKKTKRTLISTNDGGEKVKHIWLNRDRSRMEIVIIMPLKKKKVQQETV